MSRNYFRMHKTICLNFTILTSHLLCFVAVFESSLWLWPYNCRIGRPPDHTNVYAPAGPHLCGLRTRTGCSIRSRTLIRTYNEHNNKTQIQNKKNINHRKTITTATTSPRQRRHNPQPSHPASQARDVSGRKWFSVSAWVGGGVWVVVVVGVGAAAPAHSLNWG